MRTSEAGVTTVELLCGLVIVGVIGAIMVSLMTTVALRTAALSRSDELDRRSERVFAVISDAVRAQREAPGLPLWTLFKNSADLQNYGRLGSIPTSGPRAPDPRSPVLTFAKLAPDALLRAATDRRVGAALPGNSSLAAFPLCEQLLFGGSGSRKRAGNSRRFLGIAADRLVPLEGSVRTQRIVSRRCRGSTAMGAFRTRNEPWPFILQGSVQPSSEGELQPEDLIAVREVLDAFAIYLDREHTVRRASLLTVENQPVVAKVIMFRVTALPLPEISEQQLSVELAFEGDPPAARAEQWILPLARVGEQLIGIL